MLIGDAAVCVNPLNGEGIDYGLETRAPGRGAAGLPDLSLGVAVACCKQHYGRGFSVARRLALLLTFQRFLPSTGPIAMRSTTLMTIAVRVMANLVTDDDADWVARAGAAGGCRGFSTAERRSADRSAPASPLVGTFAVPFFPQNRLSFFLPPPPPRLLSS